MNNSNTTVIIPAFNEQEHIQATITCLRAHPSVFEVLVVDDGSTDQTSQLALESGAGVIRHLFNTGKSAAVRTGIDHAVTDYVMLCDADLGESASGIWPLLEPVVQSEADMTIGILPRVKSRQGFGIVKGIAGIGIHHFTMEWFQAPLSGQRVCKREMFQKISSLSKGFGLEVGLTIDAIRHGYRVIELPIEVSHRLHGRTLKGMMHRGRQLRDVVQALHCRLMEV